MLAVTVDFLPNPGSSPFSDFCGPPEPVRFPLPGGMGPHATADVAFSLPGPSACSLSVTGLRAGADASATLFGLSLEANATHVQGSVTSELGGFGARQAVPWMAFDPGVGTWSLVTYPDGFATFFNQQELFRLSGASGISFEGLRSLEISGATVVNASLGAWMLAQEGPGGKISFCCSRWEGAGQFQELKVDLFHFYTTRLD